MGNRKITLEILRLKAGFNTREEFANALKVKRYNVDKWETLKASPKTKDLKKIAKTLNVDVSELLKCFE